MHRQGQGQGKTQPARKHHMNVNSISAASTDTFSDPRTLEDGNYGRKVGVDGLEEIPLDWSPTKASSTSSSSFH